MISLKIWIKLLNYAIFLTLEVFFSKDNLLNKIKEKMWCNQLGQYGITWDALNLLFQ